MKHLKLIIALFVTTAIIFSCKPKNNNPTTPVVPSPPATAVKKAITDVLTASEIQSITANANSAARGKPVKLPQRVTVATASIFVLSDNGGGSFSINYNGATNLVYMFFRGGDSLSVSGNVYPVETMSFYQNPVTTFQSTFTRTYYQSLVVTGSALPDANGVVGADWVFTYTNVVQ